MEAIRQAVAVGQGELVLTADADRLSGRLALATKGAPIDAEVVLQAIQGLGLRLAPEESAQIRKAIEGYNAAPGEGIDPLFEPRGTPPTGCDGEIAWVAEAHKVHGDHFAVGSEKDEFDVHDMGAPILVVTAGETIARIIPPIVGEPGRDIFGKALPALGRAAPPLKLGTHVHLDEDGRLVADRDGMVVRQKDQVGVEPVYKVRGDVDFKAGNIVFSGAVEVYKDVLDGFQVHGDTGVIVRGLVGAAKIGSAHGDVEIAGGMAGLGRGSVVAGRDLKSRHLNHVTAEAARDILVRGEVVNSTLSAGQRIVSGKIVGGRAIAGKGMEIGTTGSHIGVKTFLVVTAGAGGQLLIRKQLYSETMVKIGACEKQFSEDVRGPICISIDDERRELKVTPWAVR